MKICFLADAGSIHVQKWAQYFSDEGNEVHIISFREAQIKGVRIHYINPHRIISISPVASFISKIGYLFWARRIRRLIKKISPDILHAHWATSYGLLGALSGFHPFILSTWGNDIIISPQKYWIIKKLVEFTLRKADLVTATSKMLAEATSKFIYDEKPVHTIPFGVDVDLFSPLKEKSLNDNICIGIVKALEKSYGIEYLIRALKIVVDEGYEPNLLIVGEGSLRNKLEALTETLNLSSLVEFIGEVDNYTVVEYLQKMDIFVVPSILESFGVAALEASSCAIPVIASNIGGLPEVVNDGTTGFLVPPCDSESIAAKIIQLIGEPSLRKQLGIQGRKFVLENYDLNLCGQKMEKIYKNNL